MFINTICAFILFSAVFTSPLERVHVGELQEKWTFPSDHLPIGISFEDRKGEFYLVSWNVLNSAYLNWIYNNSQGFARSAITKEDIKINENGSTLREYHVIDLLLEMVHSHIICLQECSELFIQELTAKLPGHIQIIRSSEEAVKNQNIVIYDSKIFTFVEKTLLQNVFASELGRPLMEVILERNGIHFRIFNAHLRCDSTKPQRFELAECVYARKKQGEVIIVLGDLNVGQDQMVQALSDTAAKFSQKNAFVPFSPYKTTVSPEFDSKAIDHIFIDRGGSRLNIRPSRADTILKDLQKSVDLLL